MKAAASVQTGWRGDYSGLRQMQIDELDLPPSGAMQVLPDEGGGGEPAPPLSQSIWQPTAVAL